MLSTKERYTLRDCISTQNAYSHNVGTLKRYGEHFKLTKLSCVRNSGVEVPRKPKNSMNTEKLDNNICRARSTIREYGFCNEWDYFITQTLRPNDHDRYDLKQFHREFTQAIRDLRKRSGANIRYLIVPEKHKDGAWHIHGLLAGLPEGALEPFRMGEHLPRYIRSKLQRGESIYNWPAFAARFGYVTVEPLHNKDKAVSYITKYITKDLASAVSEMGAHLYYASKGLQKAIELKRGLLVEGIPYDYENEYCSVIWFDADAVDAESLKGLFCQPTEIQEEY